MAVSVVLQDQALGYGGAEYGAALGVIAEMLQATHVVCTGKGEVSKAIFSGWVSYTGKREVSKAI